MPVVSGSHRILAVFQRDRMITFETEVVVLAVTSARDGKSKRSVGRLPSHPCCGTLEPFVLFLPTVQFIIGQWLDTLNDDDLSLMQYQAMFPKKQQGVIHFIYYIRLSLFFASRSVTAGNGRTGWRFVDDKSVPELDGRSGFVPQARGQ